METINSFKGYGKVDAREQQAFRQKTRKRLIILIISSIVLVAVIIGAVIGVVVNKNKNVDDSSPAAATQQVTPASSLKALCSVTQNPDSCFSSISSIEASSNVTTTDPEILFKLSLQVAVKELQKLQGYPSKLIIKEKTKDPRVIGALNVCEEVFDEALYYVNESLSSVQVSDDDVQDLTTWLSTSITEQETCLDALQELNSTHYGNSTTILNDLRSAMRNSTEFASNSLAIGSKILSLLGTLNIPVHRRRLLLLSDDDPSDSELAFPSWVRAGERRLLIKKVKPKPNATVAQDGSGNYTTIADAVAAVPSKSTKRFVIYIKKGTYLENVILDKSKWNVMMYGDGKTATIVSGSKNFVDGTPTYSTATVAVSGKGFIAKDMRFVNTAGAVKQQAVAFRSGSDRSIFYRCAFDAFQDTLYAYSNRQFYSECDVSGTVDFIFGNAAVVFQNCNIMPKQPLPKQFNTITAQGKTDPNQNTGISIQKCTLVPFSGNLTAQTYLGRPWKDYSTTVIMQSTIGPFLNPLGWIGWAYGVEPPATIFYGEFKNTGVGSNTSGRVKWAGYLPTLTVEEAGKFTVGKFIQGNHWLADANVQFQPSL